MTTPVDPTRDRDDVEDLDEENDVDQPVAIACQWGMPAWCSTGRHHRCYFTTDAETIKIGTYGHHDGHVWVCPCPCHAHQGYPPCPHPEHRNQEQAIAVRPERVAPIQVNLF